MTTRRKLFALAAALLPLATTVPAAPAAGASAADPLAAEIARWDAFVASNASTDETWAQIKGAVGPVLAKADEALLDGRRLLALNRLAAAHGYLRAWQYENDPAAPLKRDAEALEAEWNRLGRELAADIAPPPPAALVGVAPAAVRAIAEAAIPQVRSYYTASLDYGRATSPDYGYLYLGSALAERDLVAFCRTLREPAPAKLPAIRSIRPEIDALQGEILALYKPPASLDRHPEFIAASAALKEARELDSAGLRYGALLRYLDASLRSAALRDAGAGLGKDAIEPGLREFESRAAAGGVDHTIARIYLESARGDVAHATPEVGPKTAAAIIADVLPRYFAALDPPRVESPRPPPEVTVTLVRWPYT
ncbi:MAG: hypothetical protein HY049_17390 [Acidobacteria bacterium]|nr:hypothetical protein [Acidobacteriota bacterium]